MCSYFGKLGVFCFLETPILRFALSKNPAVLHNFLWVSSTVQKVQEKFQFQEKACMEGRMDIGTDPIL